MKKTLSLLMLFVVMAISAMAQDGTSKANAIPIQSGDQLQNTYYMRYYSFNVDVPGDLEIEVTGTMGSYLEIYLQNATLGGYQSLTNVLYGLGTIKYEVTEPGTYYLYVYNYGGNLFVNFKFPEAGPHDHAYASEWSYDKNTHWHACTSTEGYCTAKKGDEAEHTFEGATCTVCGYTIPSYTVSVVSGDNGTAALSEGGATAGILEDHEVTLVATPAEGYMFDYWEVDGVKVSRDNPYTFTVTKDITVKANFKVYVPELTICEGLTSNQYVPVYGYYNDCSQTSQIVYPADMLASLKGKALTGLTFYLGSPVNSLGGEYTVYLTEVESDLLGGINEAYGDRVFEGQVNMTGETMEVKFTEQYVYNGGNLLITFDHTKTGSDYPNTYFYGVPATGTHSYLKCPTAYVNTGYSFLPKVTLGYSDEVDSRERPEIAMYYEAEDKVKVGQTITISAEVTSEDYDGELTFASSDESIATVDPKTGVVTGVAEGEVKIIANASATEKYKAGSAFLTVTVFDAGGDASDPLMLSLEGANSIKPANAYAHKFYALDIPEDAFEVAANLDVAFAGGWYPNYTMVMIYAPSGETVCDTASDNWGSSNAHAYITEKGRYIFEFFAAYDGVTATITLTNDATATGLDKVNMNLNDAEIYNINGQRVNTIQKGIYIINGKKVTVK